MEKLFTPETLDAFRRMTRLFDPEGIFNPGKIFPEIEGGKQAAA